MTVPPKNKMTTPNTNEASFNDSGDYDKRLKKDASELAQLIYDIYLEEKTALAGLDKN